MKNHYLPAVRDRLARHAGKSPTLRPMGRPEGTGHPSRLLPPSPDAPVGSVFTARKRAAEALMTDDMQLLMSRASYWTFRSHLTGEAVNVYRDGEVWRAVVAP